MAQIQQFIDKGNLISFTARFRDEDGNLFDPESANIVVAFYAGRVLTTATVNMLFTGDHKWLAQWDSSVSDGGQVDFCITSTNPKVVYNGSIKLQINRSDP